ncbi:MAG TPA: flavodoxin domain-containing protein [Acidimicrobiales bacterium]|nr:flavodoxin domain-containing protein [Acidimicrobiales bacterium]
MKAVIVYESMFGATRRIAQAVADGLGQSGEVQVVRADQADGGLLDGADLLVVGAPTHAWSMPRAGTRKGAPGYSDKPGSGLTLEPGADQAPGVREWLASLGTVATPSAAFDTRIKGPALLTGRASRAIARGLHRRGAPLTVPPKSFLVDRGSHLLAGEEDKARAWGSRLAASRSLASK